MMKDRLYTVNKWNKNLFAVGGQSNPFGITLTKPNVVPYVDWSNPRQRAAALGTVAGLTGGFGQQAANGPFGNSSTSNSSSPSGMGFLGGMAGGLGSMVGNAVGNAIGGGYSADGSGLVGGLMAGVQSVNTGIPWLDFAKNTVAGAATGIFKRGFGVKENKENIAAVEQNTLAARNAGNELAGSNSNDAIIAASGNMVSGTGFSAGDLYKNGWWTKKGTKKGNAKLAAEQAALAAQTHGLTLGVQGADTALDDEVMGNFAAFGGPIGMAITSPYTGLERPAGALDMLMQDKYIGAIDRRTDALAKKANTTYADGGLKSAFLDEFGSDPIGAAVRYNQGLEMMEAEREAAANAAAQQAAYDDMQRRMMALETRNQGLEAMVNANMTAPVTSFVTPSEAVKSWAALPGEGDDRNASDTRMASKGSLRDFIKAHEGFRSNAYWLEGEPAPTIGYGFHMVYPGTTRKVKMGDKLTQEEADRYLDVALDSIGDTLSKKVPNWDKMAQHQRDALVDLAYGTGTNGAHFKKNSKLISALRNEDWEEAEKQLVSRSKSLPKYDEYLLKISKQRQKMFRDGEYNMKAFGGNKFSGGGEESTSKKILQGWYNALVDTPIKTVKSFFPERGYHGGTWSGAGDEGHWTNPDYYYNDIYPADTLLVPTVKTFNQAFAEAKRKGLDTFEFNGGTYGTQLGDNPNWRQAGDARVSEGLVPVIIPADTIRRRTNRPKEDVIHPKRIPIMRAFGGELGTNGTDFTNGLLQIDAGGSHQSNPLGGVPLGVDPEGVPNLVEEGETVFNDYVFSTRMKVPKGLYNELGLGGVLTKSKHTGLSFADASKKLAQESEQRPNDPISLAGLEASMAKLAEVQEAERDKKEMKDTVEGKEFAYGGLAGNVYAGNGPWDNWLRRGINGEYYQTENARTNVPNQLDLVNPAAWLGMYSRENEIRGIMASEGVNRDTAEQLYDLRVANTQTGVAPVAGGRGVAGYRVRPVNQNTRGFQQSRMPMPSARRMPAGAPPTSTTTGRDLVAEANAAANTRNLSIGEQWAANANRQSTSSLERIVEGPNVKGGRFTGRETTTRRLNPRPTGEHVTGRGSMDEYDAAYNSLVGTMGVKNRNPQIGRLWPWAVGASGVAGGLGLYMYDDATRQANLARMNAALGNSTNAVQPDTTAVTPAVETIQQRLTPQQTNSRSSSFVGRLAQNIRDRINAAVPGNTSGTSSPSSPGVASSPRSSRGTSANRANNRIEMEAFNGIPITAPRETLQGRIGDADLNFEGMADRYTGLRDYVAANIPEEYNPYPTWMRYAPVIGAGALTLADLLGLTNRPDYTYADKIEAAAERAGTAPNVRYNPIGNYLRYQPMDIWAEQNRLNANSRGTERSILNSGASQGAKMAGLLASGYNDQVASGELYRKGLEYNDARRQAIADFNRRTDMFNAQMGLEAAMANARYTQAARQYGLSGLVQAAAMRDAIDQRVGAARSLNLNNLLTSLGNIGRENFALNQINSDRSRRHGARANGTSYYKG